MTVPQSHGRSGELTRLHRAAAAVIAVLVVVGGGTIAAIVLLLDGTRSDDLQRVAILALCGGALGAATRAVFEVIERLQAGVELGDGTIVERSAIRRAARARELGVTKSEGVDGPGAARDEKERAREVEWELSRAEHSQLQFSSTVIPWLLVLPIVGAALGLAAFAGAVGGFLVATGDRSPDYNPAGLLFLSLLAGLFAESFIRALARSADALFGTSTTERPAGGPQRSDRR